MLRLMVFLSGCLFSMTTMAVHLDVAVSNDGGKIKTDFCLAGGPACDQLPVLDFLGIPPLTAPVDLETGKNIFISDFDDFEGGPNGVDDPGFISGANQLPATTKLSYTAVGQLQYWDPATGEWGNTVPGTTRIELFGGTESLIITDPVICGGLPFCIIEQATSTLFSESGISGAPVLAVGDTDATGQLHVHLDWFIEDSNDNPGGPNGAYMVEMHMTAPGLTDSDPFFVMFAKGLTTEQFGEALADRIVAPETQVPMPTVYIFILMLLLPMIATKYLKLGNAKY